jgi:hypothetical protein
MSLVSRPGVCRPTFQAGLDALDPDCPCFVQDRAIQECIYLGLRYQVLMA